MATIIHQTAIVSSGVDLADDVEVGPFAIIEDNVTIGSGCKIGRRALVASGTRLGSNVQVYDSAILGNPPQDLKYKGEPTTLTIGDNTIIREFATLHRGTTDRMETRVGSNCLLMAYSHVAHDCLLGDDVIMANSVNLAGHVEIGDYAIIGGIVPIHQFVRIGEHSMIGGGFRVPMDICPYALCAGYPLRVAGVNSIGLKRRGFAIEVVRTLQKAFKILFRSGFNTTQALDRIKSEIEPIDEVRRLVSFVESSHRGICS